MFYHICLTIEYPEGEWGKTRDFYLRDLSERSLSDFLLDYHAGLSLRFGKEIVNPKPFRSLIICSTERPSSEILPPLKAKFEREHAIKKSQEDARNRSRRVMVLNPFDISGHFFADRTLMRQGKTRTSDFIRPFISTPENHIRAATIDPEMDNLSPAGIVALNQRRRFRYLEYLYQVSSGDSARMYHWREIGATLGMSDDVASMSCCYLRQKGLANGEYMTDGISQAGIDEYEQAVTKPDQPTEHFPQYVTINAGHGANVAVSSQHFSQTATGNQQRLNADLAGVAEMLQELRQVIPVLNLDTDSREDLEMIVVELQSQVEAQSPDRSKLRAGLRSVGSLLGNLSLSVAANAITQPIMDRAHDLIKLFSSSAG